MGRSAWATILVAAALPCWVGPAPCSGQSPPAPATSPAAGLSAIRIGRYALTAAAVPTAGPVPSQGRPPSSPALAQPVSAPGALGSDAYLSPAPTEPSDLRFPINLATALRLADARPLVVAAAQAGVWIAEAQLSRTKVLWIPTLMFGADYIRHDGGGPDFNKGIMTAPSVNFFYAGGGMYQMLNVTDAYFEPLAARQELNSRHWDVQAAKNDALQQTADAYFRVHQQRGTYAGSLYAVARGRDLIAQISSLAADLVPRVEVDRARNLVADLEQQATSAREEWRVSSADLTQVLRLDPRAVVIPLEHDHLQVTLVDPARPLDDLIPIALTNRPELASNRALIQAAEARLRREKMRPLLPIVMINGFQAPSEYLQAGLFGLGRNNGPNQFTGRDDLSYQLIWQLEGFGIGNLARIKKQRGDQSKAIIDLRKAQDRVAADVIREHARLQSAAARVGQADRSLRAAIIAFNGNLEGLGQTTRFGDVLMPVTRPQEVVYALQLMKLSLNEYFATVAEYNRAGFAMYHALGYPARELAVLQPPGEFVPVETRRPEYLPPVGVGPPPATH